MTPIHLSPCAACVVKLRRLRDELGAAEMIARAGSILCEACIAQIPGYEPGLRPRFALKRAGQKGGDA